MGVEIKNSNRRRWSYQRRVNEAWIRLKRECPWSKLKKLICLFLNEYCLIECDIFIINYILNCLGGCIIIYKLGIHFRKEIRKKSV